AAQPDGNQDVVRAQWVPAAPGATAISVPLRTCTVATSDVHSLLTPRVDPGVRSSSASGYSSPPVVTPTAGPCTGRRLTRSPGRPVRVDRSRTTHRWAAPTQASTATAAYRGPA